MGSGYFSQAIIFLVKLFFDIYILTLILRYLLTIVRVDSLNPLSTLIMKVTNPLLKPLRRTIPGYFGIDWASIISLFLVQAIEIILVALIITGGIPAFSGLTMLTIAYLLRTILYIYLFIIIIQVIISWINPNTYNPITTIMYQISEPILKPIRQFIPSSGGLDFSPLVALIIINLLMILIISPLMDLGQKLSL